MSTLLAVKTAVPDYGMDQTAIGRFMIDVLGLTGRDADRLALLYERSAIRTRYSAIPDYGCTPADRVLFPPSADLEPVPDVARRMNLFHSPARELSLKTARLALRDIPAVPTHVISVTCTGLAAPGLDIDLVTGLDLPSDTVRTSVNFMGCYAAFHALKLADAFCRADPDSLVLVVAVELCTLHFQKVNEPDHLLANSLFADGCAAFVVAGENRTKQFGLPGLAVRGFRSELATHGRADMAWSIGSTGFLMTLSSYIPDLVKHGIGPLTRSVLNQSGLDIPDVDHWAIHPGGRKILDSAIQALNLDAGQLSASYTVLKQYGNMSSPTIGFVLEELWNTAIQFNRRERVFAAGFGPGLTLESMVLETQVS